MKNFKRIFVFALIAISASGLSAQTKTKSSGGLYLTAKDFQQQKLTYEINCSNAKDKIKPNTFLGSATGYVLVNGEKHSFNKKLVYGYCDCQSQTYRFNNGNEYLIIDTAGFYLYYLYLPIENVKRKNLVKKYEYFFSVAPDGPLLLLTIDNLKNAFPDNHSFHYLIDESFKTDKDLISYDSFQKKYKLKYLYANSFNK